MAKQKLTRQQISLAFFGGALGTLLRWSLSQVMPSLEALWLVNILGALLAGVFAGHAWFKIESRKIFWSTGFAGGFTTLSAIAVLPLTETLDLLSLVMTIAAMTIAGFAAYWLGLKTSARMSSK